MPVNGGPVLARNAGVAAARGRYIAALDADDLCRPDRFARQVAYLEANPATVLLGTAADLLIDGDRAANAGAADNIAAILCDLLAEHLGVPCSEVQSRFTATGSLVRTIDQLRGQGRTLVPLEIEEPNAVEAAIAEGEALDPEGAGEYFQPAVRGGLMTRLRHWGRSRPA